MSTYVLLVLFALVVSECSPEARYRVLSTAFDGVPIPESMIVADSTLVEGADSSGAMSVYARAVPRIFRHQAYGPGKCQNCHDFARGNRLLEKQPDLCFTCHENFADRYTVLHGPVASGFCTECHNPHQARYEKLLKRTGQAVCLTCHLKSDVFRNDVHEGEEGTVCYECHDPHGGDDRFLF